MQPEKLTEVRSWFQKAANDLRGADIDLTVTPPLVEDALFHCQQAVEKALKGFLTAHDKIFRKTHDLDILATICESIDSDLISLLGPARDLTVFAWEFRYPGEAEIPSMEEAKEFLALARQVYKAIISRFSDEINHDL